MNRLPEDLTRRVAGLIRAGWRNCEIESELGVNRNTISGYRQMMGVKNPASRIYPQIVADAQQMPIAHVAKKYGFSRQHIYNILKRGTA